MGEREQLPNSEMWMTEEERRMFAPSAFKDNFEVLEERFQEQILRVGIRSARISPKEQQ